MLNWYFGFTVTHFQRPYQAFEIRLVELWNPANDEDNESQKHDESIPDMDYHFKRVKSIQHHSFDTTKGNLMARIFLRHVGSTYDQKGNYIINEKDLFAWFENLDYLRIYSEFDTF